MRHRRDGSSDQDPSNEESQAKRVDPHALVLSMDAKDEPDHDRCSIEDSMNINGLRTLDVNDETGENLGEFGPVKRYGGTKRGSRFYEENPPL